MKMLLITAGLLLLAGCATDNQKLLEADNASLPVTARALKYALLDECSATLTTGCHDPLVKAELKGEGAVLRDATGADAVVAATGAISHTLDVNNINCGPAATDTCP